MNIEQHIAAAGRIENSLRKCSAEDVEMQIEAAMSSTPIYSRSTRIGSYA
jgi:hypothetical protein